MLFCTYYRFVSRRDERVDIRIASFAPRMRHKRGFNNSSPASGQEGGKGVVRKGWMEFSGVRESGGRYVRVNRPTERPTNHASVKSGEQNEKR